MEGAMPIIRIKTNVRRAFGKGILDIFINLKFLFRCQVVGIYVPAGVNYLV